MLFRSLLLLRRVARIVVTRLPVLVRRAGETAPAPEVAAREESPVLPVLVDAGEGGIEHIHDNC